MLRERGTASLDEGGRIRRCFADGEFELHVLTEPDGSMYGFHLFYPENDGTSLLSWTPIEQYHYYRRGAGSGGAEMAPRDPGAADSGVLFRRLRPATAALEPRVRSFVLELVFSHEDEVRRCRYCSERRPSAWHCPRCWLRACSGCFVRKALKKSRCTWTEATHDWRLDEGDARAAWAGAAKEAGRHPGASS